MRILYLLFAVLFLLLVDAPGFSQAQLTTLQCGLRQGNCLWRCPSNSIDIGPCTPFGYCCRRRYFD